MNPKLITRREVLEKTSKLALGASAAAIVTSTAKAFSPQESLPMSPLEKVGLRFHSFQVIE